MILKKRRILFIRFVIIIKNKAVDYYVSKKFLVLKDQYVEDNKNKKKFVLHNYNNDRTLECMDDEIMLIFLYPRLDEKVSETINHLLKAPFCIHPKTSI